MAEKNHVPVPDQVDDEGAGRRVAAGLLAAGMFLGGFVVLLLAAGFAYDKGVPAFVLAIVALVLLAGVFALLRRWAGEGEA